MATSATDPVPSDSTEAAASWEDSIVNPVATTADSTGIDWAVEAQNAVATAANSTVTNWDAEATAENSVENSAATATALSWGEDAKTSAVTDASADAPVEPVPLGTSNQTQGADGANQAIDECPGSESNSCVIHRAILVGLDENGEPFLVGGKSDSGPTFPALRLWAAPADTKFSHAELQLRVTIVECDGVPYPEYKPVNVKNTYMTAIFNQFNTAKDPKGIEIEALADMDEDERTEYLDLFAGHFAALMHDPITETGLPELPDKDFPEAVTKDDANVVFANEYAPEDGNSTADGDDNTHGNELDHGNVDENVAPENGNTASANEASEPWGYAGGNENVAPNSSNTASANEVSEPWGYAGGNHISPLGNDKTATENEDDNDNSSSASSSSSSGQVIDGLSVLQIHHDPDNIIDSNILNGTVYPDAVQPQVLAFRRALLAKGPLKLLVLGSYAPAEIVALQETILEQRQLDPLSAWYDKNENGKFHLYDGKTRRLLQKPHLPLPVEKRPVFTVQQEKRAHSDIHEYTHYTGQSALREHELESAHAQKVFEAKIKLCQAAGAGDKLYWGYLKMPPEFPTLADGDTVKLWFGAKYTQEGDEFKATVSSNQELGQADENFLEIKRKYDKETATWYYPKGHDIPEDKVVKYTAMTDIESSRAAIATAEQVTVLVQVEYSNKPYETNKKALFALTDPDIKDPAEKAAMKTTHKILMGTRLMGLEVKDYRQSFPDTITVKGKALPRQQVLEQFFSKLNDKQQEGLQKASRAVEGMNFIEGVAGSGKSFTALEMALAKILFPKPLQASQLLAVYPFNEAATAAAVAFYERLKAARKEYGIEQETRVIRMHAIPTEHRVTYRNNPREKFISHDWFSFEEIEESVLPELIGARLQRKRASAHLYTKHGLGDPRLLWLEGSLGWHCEKELTRDKSRAKPQYAKLNSWIETMISMQKEGSNLSPEQKGEMSELTNQLIRQVLYGCDACFTTVFTSNQPIVYGALVPDIMIIEEAAKMTESDTIGCFAFYKRTVQTYIFVGDRAQGPPYVTSTESTNCFSKQQRYSSFSRHIDNGHPAYTRLTVQKRTVEEIAREIAYAFRIRDLVTSPEVASRPSAMRAHQFIEETFGIHSHIFIVDVSDTVTGIAGTTKFNQSTAGVGMEIFRYALKYGYDGSDLAVLSPYLGSTHGFNAGQSIMENAFPSVRSALVQSFDKVQGAERSIAIFEFPNTKGVRFLKTNHRIYQGLSRAGDAAILVMDLKAMASNKGFVNCGLGQLIKSLRSQELVYTWSKPAVPSDLAGFMPQVSKPSAAKGKTVPICYNCGQKNHRKNECQNEKTPFCPRCRDFGHVKANCPNKETAPAEDPERKCFKCEKTGHSIKNCPKMPKCEFCEQPGHSKEFCKMARADWQMKQRIIWFEERRGETLPAPTQDNVEDSTTTEEPVVDKAKLEADSNEPTEQPHGEVLTAAAPKDDESKDAEPDLAEPKVEADTQKATKTSREEYIARIRQAMALSFSTINESSAAGMDESANATEENAGESRENAKGI